MRRWGTVLMILGANIIAGSIAAAFWQAALECVVDDVHATCRTGTVSLFLTTLMTGEGFIYWLVIAIGAWVFWRGKRMRN